MAKGASTILAPTVVIQPLSDYSQVDDALSRLSIFDWIVFTSVNGVLFTCQRLENLASQPLSLDQTRIAAIGPETAACAQRYIGKVDLVPERFVADTLGESLADSAIKGDRLLLLRAEQGRNTLPRILQNAGVIVDDIPVYRTTPAVALPAEAINALEREEIDWMTFTSPSTFDNLIGLLSDKMRATLNSIKLASIGPATSDAMRAGGYEPTVEATEHSIEGLVKAICDYNYH